MREGGHSAKSLKQRFNGWNEIKKAWQVNNKKIPFLIIPLRILNKFNQYFVWNKYQEFKKIKL